MKTTVEITDSLFEQAKSLAEKEKSTLRALVEEGLRKVIEERSETPKFELLDFAFKGTPGFQPGMENLTFQEMLEMSYEGRGT